MCAFFYNREINSLNYTNGLNVSLFSDVSQDLFDLLNIPDSPDQQLFTPDPGDQTQDDSGSASVPHSPTPFTLPPASKKSFQKDILKLMMDGIKISLVGPKAPVKPVKVLVPMPRCETVR